MATRRFHLCLLACCAAFYLLNAAFFKPLLPPPFQTFFISYFNDLLAGLFICSFLNFWLELWGWRQVRSPLLLAAFLLLCGCVWEFGPLLWKPSGVFDPWDFAVYLSGGGIYLLLRHLLIDQKGSHPP